MSGVSIRIEGGEATGQRLASAAAQLESPRALWDEIGRAMVVSTQQRFETETEPDGTPWPASIRVLTQGGKTLTDTAAMRNSITHEASNDSVAWGTNAIHAAVHQFGATIRAKTSAGLRFRIGERWITKDSVQIPRRAFIGLSGDDEIEIVDIAQEFMAMALGGADAR